MKHIIKNGRVVDPANKLDDNLDILVSDGKIEIIGKGLNDKDASIVDAKGCIVAPGLIDMHTHLREPGREDKETVFTGTRAAIRGGFTSVACMPNTDDPLDNPDTIKLLKDIIKKDAHSNVYIIGAITKERKGSALTDFRALKGEGVIAVSDDGCSVENEDLLLEALKRAKKEDLLVIEHCEDQKISAGGVINKSFISTKMGLKGIRREAEYSIVKRDIDIAKKASAKLHIAHVSCKESIDIIRKAKKEGLRISAETCPHYFSLTEECCVTYDTNMKMNPPLRAKEDVEAVKEGLKDGTIDVIATDHAPHTDAEKDVEFDFAPFGIIGLETAISLAVMELIDNKVLSWAELITKMSVNPSVMLGAGRGSLSKGGTADICVIDPAKNYIYTKDIVESKSKNSPFLGWTLKGKVTNVIVGGRIIMKDGTIM